MGFWGLDALLFPDGFADVCFWHLFQSPIAPRLEHGSLRPLYRRPSYVVTHVHVAFALVVHDSFVRCNVIECGKEDDDGTAARRLPPVLPRCPKAFTQEVYCQRLPAPSPHRQSAWMRKTESVLVESEDGDRPSFHTPAATPGPTTFMRALRTSGKVRSLVIFSEALHPPRFLLSHGETLRSM